MCDKSNQTIDVLIVFADPVLFPAAMPYGAMIVADTLRGLGLRVELIQPFMDKTPQVALREACAKYVPKIIGISFRNLDTAGFGYDEDGEQTFLPELLDLLVSIKDLECIVAIGGSGFSVAPTKILDISGADIGFAGPSEVEFAKFCWRVAREGETIQEATLGLSNVILPGNQHVTRPSVLPLMKIQHLDQQGIEYARMAGGAIPVRTKSGCSSRCSYCVVPRIEPLSIRPWEDIYSELRLILDADLQERVFIADGEFNLPSVQRAIELSERIRVEFGNQIRWRCYLSEKNITPTLLKTMKSAGCIGVSITVDSLTDGPRLGLLKGCPAATALKAVEMCLESGIETGINLIFGGPNETFASAEKGAYLAQDFNRQGGIITVTVGFRYYPATPLAKIASSPKFSIFAKPCKSFPWLGVFCSPVPPGELASHIIRILEPSDTVTYTHTTGDSEKTFYKELAYGTHLLAEGHLKTAKSIFQGISVRYPDRLEPKRGLLRVIEEIELLNATPLQGMKRRQVRLDTG